MKIELEAQDKEEIAQRVLEKLQPLISHNCKHDNIDVVFTKKTLSKYLNISESTINKLLMNKQIPHFKIQSGQSSGVRFFKREIDRWIYRQTIPDIKPLNAKR